jgi:hypothetical protein
MIISLISQLSWLRGSWAYSSLRIYEYFENIGRKEILFHTWTRDIQQIIV